MTAAQPGSAGDRTFRGRDPQTVAGQAISAVTPTKCQARTRLIIAVPTFITGFYGMNVPYPGFQPPVRPGGLGGRHDRRRRRALRHLPAAGLAVGGRAGLPSGAGAATPRGASPARRPSTGPRPCAG